MDSFKEIQVNTFLLRVKYNSALVSEDEVDWFLDYFFSESRKEKEFLTGQLIELGISLLLLKENETGGISVFEPDWKPSGLINFIESISNSIVLLKESLSVVGKLNCADSIDYPSIRSSMVICNKVNQSNINILERLSYEGSDSGWFAGCNDTNHNHSDPNELKRISIYEFCTNFLGFRKVLSIPPPILVRIDLSSNRFEFFKGGKKISSMAISAFD